MAAVNVIVTVLQCALSALCKGFAFCMQINALLLPSQVCALSHPQRAQMISFLQNLLKKTHLEPSSTEPGPVFRIETELGQFNQQLFKPGWIPLTHNCSCKC